MKIIKPGKIRMVRLVCPYCGCEFACNPTTAFERITVADFYARPGWATFTQQTQVRCPQDGCNGLFDPWSETSALPEFRGGGPDEDED